jgi:hypothetical protein
MFTHIRRRRHAMADQVGLDAVFLSEQKGLTFGCQQDHHTIVGYLSKMLMSSL